MSVDCTCADWDENIAKVNGPILLQTARSGGAYQYSGKKFAYCPWCGRPLSGATVQPAEHRHEWKPRTGYECDCGATRDVVVWSATDQTKEVQK